MTKMSRRIIFYFLLLLFVVLAPSIIFYALGYNFDFNKKIFVATGGIYLKSHPSNAEIYINDKPGGETSKFIKRLLPKIYEIKITKEDYHLWQKKLVVEPRMVTKASNILLLPSNPKIFLLDKTDEINLLFKEPYPLSVITEIIKKKSKYTISKISNLKYEPSNEKAYFISNSNLYSLKIDTMNINNSVLSPVLTANVINYVIYRNGIIFSEKLTEKIHELDLSSLKSVPFFEQVFPGFDQGKWILSDDNKKLLCQKDKSVEILWLDNVNNNSIIRKKGDIEKIDFSQKISDVIWYPKTDEHLIISTDNAILITELDNRPPRNTINFIATENPQIKYDAKTSTLYFLSQEKLYKTEL